MTGAARLHMVIGFGLLSVIAWMAAKDRFSPEWYTPVEMAGLYWHFVDIVWIFLFPLLYLVDRAHQPPKPMSGHIASQEQLLRHLRRD